MKFGECVESVLHFVRDSYEGVKGARRGRVAIDAELAAFERLRRTAEAEGIAQDGPLSERAVREIFDGMRGSPQA